MTLKAWLGWTAFLIFLGYCIWVQTWSSMAKECYEKGGTQFDWLAWSCTRIERL